MTKQSKTLKTGNTQATKPGKVKETIRTNLGDALDVLCDRFLGVVSEAASLSEELGAITRDAAGLIKDEETIGVFVAGCAELADCAGLTSGSVKVYLSNMRGVLRAMHKGWKPADECVTLRAMYDAIPDEHRGQGANKGNRAPRQPVADNPPAREPVASTSEQNVAILSGAKAGNLSAAQKADARKAAITALFGFHSAELEEAVLYAAEHAGMFQTWAKASAKAAMQVPALKKAA